MARFINALTAALLVSGCADPSAPPSTNAGPFLGLDAASLPAPDRQSITEASEDFRAVVAGKKPVHAVFDKNAPLPSDGGTTFYRGNGYRLTILASIFVVGKDGQFVGSAYGPIIDFDPNLAPGNTAQISDIRVYSKDELHKLLDH